MPVTVGAPLSGAHFSGAHFSGAHFFRAQRRHVDLLRTASSACRA